MTYYKQKERLNESLDIKMRWLGLKLVRLLRDCRLRRCTCEQFLGLMMIVMIMIVRVKIVMMTVMVKKAMLIMMI